jgi:hypothetical protein
VDTTSECRVPRAFACHIAGGEIPPGLSKDELL